MCPPLSFWWAHRRFRRIKIRRYFSLKKKSNLGGYLFISSAVAIVVLFIFYPLFVSIKLSFTSKSFLIPGTEFVGLETYKEVILDEVFRLSLKNSIKWIVFGTLLSLGIGGGIGIFLSIGFKGSKTISALILLPWLLPNIIAAVSWKWMYHPDLGVISFLIESLAGKEIRLLSNVNLVLWLLLIILVWRLAPLASLLFLSGIQSIPKELFEAAEVDGADSYQKFRYITIPHLSYPLIIGTLLISLFILKDFTIVWVTTQGGPVHYSEILPTYIYRLGFYNWEVGKAAATSMLYFIFILSLSLAYLFVFRKVWRGT